MTAGTVAPGARGDTASFDLERFEWTAPDRVEVAGHWLGVRGLRFMRPTLELRTEDGERHRLLALLEHKPWASEDGREWVAAFPWKGERVQLASAELAAGPSVTVELPLPGGRSSKPKGRVPAKQPRRPATSASSDGDRDERLKLRLERDGALAARDAARSERDEALASRDAALRERDDALRQAAEVEQARELRSELDALRFERDGAKSARDEARAELDALKAERDAALAARDAALAKLEALMAERDGALAERGATLRARELAIDERDRARASLDAAIGQHETASVERDALRRQLDAAIRDSRQARRERDEVRGRLAEQPTPAPAAPPAPPPEAETVPLPMDAAASSPWRARLLALGALAAMLLIAAVAVLHVFS
ncbi:MAG: hypothetical protein ACJ77M_14955 [Thermoleophilaceae bacterium]